MLVLWETKAALITILHCYELKVPSENDLRIRAEAKQRFSNLFFKPVKSLHCFSMAYKVNCVNNSPVSCFYTFGFPIVLEHLIVLASSL